MLYRQLITIFFSFSMFVAPLWAEDGQEVLTEEVVEPVLEDLSQQVEEVVTDADGIAEIVPETVDNGIETEAVTPSSEIIATTTIGSDALIKDVVLVLDNSGSMKKNDPQFLTKQAVTEFINNLDEATRASIVIFGEDVRTAVPLTDVDASSRQNLLDSLSQINYQGLFTNSPAAIESAIYDLKNNGREDARKVIVFMTDGIVDTGNADRDLEKTKWLKEDLAADAADAGIKIFGIAFTENADFELIQSLAQKTDGEYYRALKADDLQNVFAKLNTLVNAPDEPEVPDEPQVKEIIVEKIIEKVVEAPASQDPIVIEVPVGGTPADNEAERKRSILILVALAVLILAVIAMVLMLLRGSKNKSRDEEPAQEAYLKDLHGVVGGENFSLGNKPTMMGRVAGKDADYLNYFVIPETTIGRRHALIEYKDFSYWIIDQGSINGTFVNDKIITSEVRLKHGDIVRLHKVEFEFIMPEMEDSGMTVISNTVLGSQGVVPSSEEATLIPGMSAESQDDDLPEPDFDFDITGTAGDENVIDEDEEDTIIRGAPEAGETSSSDETIMLDENDGDDIMDGYDDDDATIRPD